MVQYDSCNTKCSKLEIVTLLEWVSSSFCIRLTMDASVGSCAIIMLLKLLRLSMR